MTQLLLSRCSVPLCSTFSPPPFSPSVLKVSLSLSISPSYSFLERVIQLSANQPLLFFSHLSDFSELYSAVLLSLNVFCLCILGLFLVVCKARPPPSLSNSLSLSLRHSASHLIPTHLPPSLPLQLWQRTISPPILSCVPRLPWTRAAVMRD